MNVIRDISEALNVHPETFNYLIMIVIFVGGGWAVKRLYADLTGPPLYEDEDNIFGEEGD